ncbi:monovalent cation:proton antiporter-2 (CPA2) family protein [Thalassotalea ponticola]|uniref:monovalent cation:proton antiporter-2 (CPA2) family protein n=1 Tax=Thalassotalea ponticola TaxID=1523392 RepID=UPI0025B438E3|nr:monovalent cation:proton antiporter-2 (CPA2) family protein [Thalassotalea ponticola]MDN3652484.1 monovalent cation:proton antiporter-2 (CPA2) family protein [Thalassotalea ponticola]
MSALVSVVIFLTAAVIAVPIFTRLKMGAILGYLCAGLVIGPSILGLINDPADILHFAELGVVFLLFIIGLELEPDKLLRMRNKILFIGGGQLLLCAAVLFAILTAFNFSWKVALVISLALALSSTAFAIGMMQEKRILATPLGQKGLSILLMQDIAVIPILLLVTTLSGASASQGAPWWIGILAIFGVLFSGRYLLNPFLTLVSRNGSAEVITASALLIVIATALAMHVAGLSMGLGAFLAGVLLANSSFRHQLEVEIAPFKGLLLGLFFIAIGMNMDLSLFAYNPYLVPLACALVAIKAFIIYWLVRGKNAPGTHPIRLALMLSQGGEFAFVIFSVGLADGLLPKAIADQATLVVGLSMALTSPLVMWYEYLQRKKHLPPAYDEEREEKEPEVIIAGFGRFGQIAGRILSANHIPFTALDNNAEHIEFVKQFGNKVFYGDATNLKLLKAAGVEHARIMFIAADSDKHGLAIAKVVKEHYPHIKIIARARSRLSVLQFRDLGVYSSVREMFDSSLFAAKLLLQEYGFDEARAENLVQVFKMHDEELLDKAYHKQRYDLEEVIKISNHGRAELEDLFNNDQGTEAK